MPTTTTNGCQRIVRGLFVGCGCLTVLATIAVFALLPAGLNLIYSLVPTATPMP